MKQILFFLFVFMYAGFATGQDKKDIEVWVYETHQDALDFGVGPAEEIFGVKRAPKVGISVLPTERFVNKYAAYAVFGNLVMLCESELATCEALIDKFD